jgi:hypothetical protein
MPQLESLQPLLRGQHLDDWDVGQAGCGGGGSCCLCLCSTLGGVVGASTLGTGPPAWGGW